MKWVDCFNNRPLYESIKNIPLAEFEKMCYRYNETPVIVAVVLDQVSGTIRALHGIEFGEAQWFSHWLENISR